jgi:hypothetical protein
VDNYASSGRLKSSILSTEDPAPSWGALTWSCVEPPGTTVWVAVRASNDPEDMGTWASIMTSGEDLSSYISDGTRYLQYKIWLETTDENVTPTVSDITVEWEPATGVGALRSTRSWFLSETSQPNPSSREGATIRFALPHSCRIELSLFDVAGRRVRTLAEGPFPVGEHAVAIQGMTAGAYFYRMTAAEFQSCGKMIVHHP